jgi:hypothetical protein
MRPQRLSGARAKSAAASLVSPWLTGVSHSQTLTMESALARELAASPRLTAAERDVGIASPRPPRRRRCGPRGHDPASGATPRFAFVAGRLDTNGRPPSFQAVVAAIDATISQEDGQFAPRAGQRRSQPFTVRFHQGGSHFGPPGLRRRGRACFDAFPQQRGQAIDGRDLLVEYLDPTLRASTLRKAMAVSDRTSSRTERLVGNPFSLARESSR